MFFHTKEEDFVSSKLLKYCKYQGKKIYKFKTIKLNFIDYFIFIFSKKLFDEHPEDPDYAPLPEDRPGGFAWGQGADLQ